jgi:PD-(D/E)XK nuclease superfamily
MTKPNVSLEPILRLSPTTWLRVSRCAWQYLLGRSNVSPLPSHPNLWLGIVVHEAIEKIERDHFSSIDQLNDWWVLRIERLGMEMTAKGAGQFLPLNDHSMQYGLKKIQVRRWLERRLNQLKINTFQKDSEKPALKSLSEFKNEKIFEETLQSNDGLLLGKPDRINRRQNCVEILDYKTGDIFENVEGVTANTGGCAQLKKTIPFN